MENKYEFFIAGRARNKENILKICDLFDKYNISYYCFLKNEDSWGYGNESQTPEEKQKEFESLGLKNEIVLNLFNQDLEGERSSKNLLLVLPAGKAAHIESGIAYGLGKKCYAIGEYEATDTLYNIFEEIFSNENELEDFLGKYTISKKIDMDNNIVDTLINDLKEPMAELNNMQLTQLNFLRDEINYIINNTIKDEKKIEKTFDMLVELLYWFGEEIEDLYFELVNYSKNINIDIANDYEKIYTEIINEEE